MTYLVFDYGQYYPNGGGNDLVSSHTDLEEAKKAAREIKSEGREVHILAVCATSVEVVFILSDHDEDGEDLPEPAERGLAVK